MNQNLSPQLRNALFEFLLRLGDDKLVLGQRLSEWCGHAPILEEDIALSNIALDCIGQANAFLTLAAEIENRGRNEDNLAYFRDEIQFKNLLIVEQPNTDFAYTIACLFFYSAYAFYFFEILSSGKLEPIAGLASKSLKETAYHVRHCKEWIIRLGDGTEKSHNRIQNAVNDLWRFTDELFYMDEVEETLIKENFFDDIRPIKEKWKRFIEEILAHATLEIPPSENMRTGGRHGRHTEHLGHLLAEMQILARSYPNAKW